VLRWRAAPVHTVARQRPVRSRNARRMSGARNLLRVAVLSGGSLHAAAAVLRESAARWVQRRPQLRPGVRLTAPIWSHLRASDPTRA